MQGILEFAYQTCDKWRYRHEVKLLPRVGQFRHAYHALNSNSRHVAYSRSTQENNIAIVLFEFICYD